MPYFYVYYRFYGVFQGVKRASLIYQDADEPNISSLVVASSFVLIPALTFPPLRENIAYGGLLIVMDQLHAYKVL
jgi:hypothetical protein